MFIVPAVGPGDGQLDALVAGGDAQLMGQAADGGGGDAGEAGGPLGGVVRYPVHQQLEGGLDRGAVLQGVAAQQARLDPGGVGADGADLRVPPQLVLRIEAALLVVHGEAAEQAVVVAAGVIDHQLGGVGVLDEKVAVVEAEGEDLVDQGQQQGAVGAGLDRHPLVRHRRVAGADGVDGDEAPALALELADGDLQRVGVMVLGGADHDEELGPLQVRPAELPEGAANGVDQPRRQIDGAKTPMGGVVGGAKLLGKQASQGLHLVAPGEQGELLGVGGAQAGQALGEELECLLPGNSLEVGGPPLGPGPAAQGLGEAGRGVLLHDPRGTLRADHALIQGVIGVALDVAHLPVA